MQCKSLWIKASAKCINVNVNVIPDVWEILWLVERSGGRDGAWGSGALTGGEGEILGPVNLLRRIRKSRVCLVVWKEKNGVCDRGKRASRTLEDER